MVEILVIAGIQKSTGCRIKSGMTEEVYLFAGRVVQFGSLHLPDIRLHLYMIFCEKYKRRTRFLYIQVCQIDFCVSILLSIQHVGQGTLKSTAAVSLLILVSINQDSSLALFFYRTNFGCSSTLRPLQKISH